MLQPCLSLNRRYDMCRLHEHVPTTQWRVASCSALEQEDVVLWVDSDIIAAPQDMLPKMIDSNLDIITPNCYFRDTSWPKWRRKLWYFDYNVFQGQSAGSVEILTKSTGAESSDVLRISGEIAGQQVRHLHSHHSSSADCVRSSRRYQL